MGVDNMKKIILIFYGVLLFSLTTYAQTNSGPSSDERIGKSIMQLVAVASLKDGLVNDSLCKVKGYPKLTFVEFVNLLAEKDKSVGGAAKEKFLSQISGMISDATKAKLPDGKIVGQMNYDLMVQNVKNMQRSLPSQGNNYCDAVNEAADGLYQKALDNIRLLPSK
jgi:hypothetical protein